jgi:hypothetical protein
MSALGRMLPVVTVCDFPAWQPAMLSRTAGFGQKETVERAKRKPFDAVSAL